MLKKSKNTLCILLILLLALLTACSSTNTNSDVVEREVSNITEESATQDSSENMESNITPNTDETGKDEKRLETDENQETSQTPETSKTPETKTPKESKAPETTKPEETKTPETQPPHTHSYGGWTVTIKAACTTKGTETRTCSCGAKETRDIVATGHSYEWVVTKEATTSAEGTKSYKCKVCGNVDKTESIPKIVSTSYNTSWGTRPHEFEEVGTEYFGAYLGTYLHWDRYGNFWWDWSSSSNGHGKQVYSSSIWPVSGSALYFGEGRWANMNHYWTEGGSTNGSGSWSFGAYSYPGEWGNYETKYNSAPSDADLVYFLGRCGDFVSRGITQDYKINKDVQEMTGLSDAVCNALIAGDKDTVKANFPSGKTAP